MMDKSRVISLWENKQGTFALGYLGKDSSSPWVFECINTTWREVKDIEIAFRQLSNNMLRSCLSSGYVPINLVDTFAIMTTEDWNP